MYPPVLCEYVMTSMKPARSGWIIQGEEEKLRTWVASRTYRDHLAVWMRSVFKKGPMHKSVVLQLFYARKHGNTMLVRRLSMAGSCLQVAMLMLCHPMMFAYT